MKWKLFVIFAGCFPLHNAWCQKISIDANAVTNWQEASVAELSNDYQYGYYVLSSRLFNQVILKSTDGKWQISIGNVQMQGITNDSKYFICQKQTDSIFFIDLISRKLKSAFAGQQLEFAGKKHRQQVIWAEQTAGGKRLNTWSTRNHQLNTYENLFAYYVNKENATVALIKRDLNSYAVSVVDLTTNRTLLKWNGPEMPSGVTISSTGKVMAFYGLDTSANLATSRLIVVKDNNEILAIKRNAIPNFTLEAGYLQFTEAGNGLIFQLTKKSGALCERSSGVTLNIWNYKDYDLPLPVSEPIKKWVRYHLNTKRLDSISLADNEDVDLKELIEGKDTLIKYRGRQEPNELQVDPRDYPKRAILMADLRKQKELTIAEPGYYTAVSFSPLKRFVVYFDRINKRYKSYELATGLTYDLSGQFHQPELFVHPERRNHPVSLPVGTGGWLANDERIIIFDEYDIWLVDPQAKNIPVCVTAQFGAKHGVRFSLYNPDNKENSSEFTWGQNVLIKAIDAHNYSEGFMTIKLKNNQLSNISLDLQPVHFYWVNRFDNGYMVARSSANSPVNWSISKDLKVFDTFSNVNPQRDYNWYSKQLVNYPMQDGSLNKGLLYKPENFDSTKKYPVIFHLYEILSDQLHMTSSPRLSPGSINPALMCSQGYIVFQPDIKGKMGAPGESAFDAIMGGANFLSRFYWVDSTKMGLSGASHGAYSINYVITRTNRFAAAVPAFGMVDEISGYNFIRDGFSRQYVAETNQERMGATLWERPDVFIANSPIFEAHRVTTPVLIMHNRADGQVPWSQGLEWFLGLRRNGKKVWMLEYENEGHGLGEEKNILDYTKRMDQFFGHYLKGEKAPRWMTQKLSMLDDRSEFDFEDAANVE